MESTKRIPKRSPIKPATGTVINKSKKTPGTNKGGRKNFQVFTVTEFIAAISQHIPEKSFQLVRYYGWYSNRGRGDREKRRNSIGAGHSEVPVAIEILDISDYRPSKIPSPQWRECIKKVWEVDPLACPKCVEMKITSFITETDIIRKILEHLGLWEKRTPTERARPLPIHIKRYEPVEDDWPQYEEPIVTVH